MKAIRALMLVLALSVCAYADGNGIMPNGRTGVMPNEVAGDMDNGKIGDMPADVVTAMTLHLLQSVLPLF